MQRLLLMSFLLVLAWAAIPHGSAAAAQSLQVVVRDPATDEFLARWKDERNGKLIGGIFWTVAHDSADGKQVKEIELYVTAVQKLMRGDGTSFVQLGGVKTFKEKLAALLTSEDEPVRALGATLLGVCGDASYTDQIATLLKSRKRTRDMPRYDRGRAAIALGLLGARQYAPELVRLLKSPNPFDRSGAAFGLGAMKATEHRKAVAALLTDPLEEVQNAAKESLDMMSAAVNK